MSAHWPSRAFRLNFNLFHLFLSFFNQLGFSQVFGLARARGLAGFKAIVAAAAGGRHTMQTIDALVTRDT